jgi:hypothetical protein
VTRTGRDRDRAVTPSSRWCAVLVAPCNAALVSRGGAGCSWTASAPVLASASWPVERLGDIGAAVLVLAEVVQQLAAVLGDVFAELLRPADFAPR